MAAVTRPTVAIIGAGPSGLVAAKEAMECGLHPVVLEKGNAIGGLWKPQSGGMWDSMQTNISRHTCMFSDFEWKEGVQDFPNQSEVFDYLCKYAETFKISPHVHLNSDVTKVAKNNEKWLVEWLNNHQEKESKIFEYVIVCSGIFSKPFIPPINGSDHFSGKMIHSSNYKTPDSFQGKTVVVLGNAFSGCEIAAEIAQTAEKVVHISRKPIWVLPRYIQKAGTELKLPNDLFFYSRAANARSEGVEPTVANARKNAWFSTVCSNQSQICPNATPSSESTAPPFVAISDSYLEKVKEGKIIITPGSVKQIVNTSSPEKPPIVKNCTPVHAKGFVLCTGYRTELPFFDEAMQKSLDFQADDPFQPLLNYKTVFHPDFPNLAFVGMYRGPFFAAMELQARMASMTFSGKIPYPSRTMMTEGISLERKIRDASPKPQFPHGDYVRFCDDLAKQIGALPDFEKMKSEDPTLFEKLWNGPYTSASFRLTGFGSNPEVGMRIIDQINKAAQ